MDIENYHEINISKEETFSPSIKKSLLKIIKREGYVTHKVYKREISTGGGNYLGTLLEVDIKGNISEEEKETHLFIKKSISLTCDESENFLSISGAYANEQLFYDELTKVYTELEDKANVPEAERLRKIKGYTVSSLDAIIMENLRKQGYRTLNRMEVFTCEFAELSVKQLAIFHGLSLVLKEKKPDYFNNKLKTISKPIYYNEKFKQVINNFINFTKYNLDQKWQRKVENCFSNLLDKYIGYFDTERSAVNCLCHGDYRQNNILIKTVDGRIDDLIPIDYQLIHIGNPINDFFYLVYLGSDRQFRKEHLTDLKRLYYDTKKKMLQHFDINVEDVYPRETFESDFKNRREMGLINAVFLFPSLFVTEEEEPNFEKMTSMAKENFKVDPKYHLRIMEVLEEYDELGYFKTF